MKRDVILQNLELVGTVIGPKDPYTIGAQRSLTVTHAPSSGDAYAHLDLNGSGGTEFVEVVFQVDGVNKFSIGYGAGSNFYLYDYATTHEVLATFPGTDRIALLSKPPATATATGRTGEVSWDSGFWYVCVAPNTWKRAALASW